MDLKASRFIYQQNSCSRYSQSYFILLRFFAFLFIVFVTRSERELCRLFSRALTFNASIFFLLLFFSFKLYIINRRRNNIFRRYTILGLEGCIEYRRSWIRFFGIAVCRCRIDDVYAKIDILIISLKYSSPAL